MIVAPEYFPRLAFFGEIQRGRAHCTDLTRPYTRQTFQNRTKIRTPTGWQWLTIPVTKQERGTPLSQIEIDYSSKWVQDHLKGLRYNYETAPFYEHYIPSITSLLSERPSNLSDLTIKTVDWGIETLKLKPLGHSITTNIGDPNPITQRSIAPEPIAQEPGYRQNFPGFEPGMSLLDALFNLGPMARELLNRTPQTPG
ncbi:MAG: WbqC family protein [Bacteroidetes bacterium]|nr:WbqC family protein [Bacteroidota bacterium]